MSPSACRRRWRAAAATIAVTSGLAAPASTSGAPPDRAPIVDYRIDVRLDPDAHTLAGRETLIWRNTTSRPAEELRFHLYLNAFKNDRTTYMRESKGISRGNRMREGEWGYIDVLSMRLGTGENLLPSVRFISPDDGNAEDESVLSVPLSAAVAPGESVTLDIEFAARLPRVFARTGHRGDFHLVAQWFPKIGVLEEAGWNCHQFHSNSEFYADFGDFDVTMTVPEGYVLGATGARSGEPTANADGTVTYRHVQRDVHDFAWTVDRDYLREVRWFRHDEQRDPIEEARVARALGIDPTAGDLRLTDVEVTLLLQPEHASQIDRHFDAVFHALRYFGYWYGPYPYATLTVVDPAYRARGAGGMEYPTFITAGTSYFAPGGRQAPESVTIHEFGHQYWYGLVASNEFEEAFLDEGFCTYSTGLILDKVYGPNHDKVEVAPDVPYLAVPLMEIPTRPRSDGEAADERGGLDRLRDFLFLRPFGPSDDTTLDSFRDLPFLNYVKRVPIDQVTTQRRRYLEAPRADALARRSWEYVDRSSYGLNSYARTALVLRTLGGILGDDAMLRLMRAYYERHRYGHPRLSDFIATVLEVAGPEADSSDLQAFLGQAFFGTELMDYAVAGAASRPGRLPRGVFGPPEDRRTLAGDERGDDGDRDNETRVLVKRLGEFVWPQKIRLEYEDLPAETRIWDGSYRWVRLEERGPRLLSARIDPEERMALDSNRTNNARSTRRHPVAGLKWWSRLLQWMQHVVYFYSGIS